MKSLIQESDDTPVRFIHPQHQSLFTLWRRVKSFCQALGCRVIDFPDPESQKGFVYLQSLSLFLSFYPSSLPSLILIPDYFSLFSRFYYSLFQQLSDSIRLLSVFCLFYSLSSRNQPSFHAEASFSSWGRVESSRVESGFGARRRYGRIVKIGHWPKTSIFRLFHRPEDEKETERYRQFLLEERVDAMVRNWGREEEKGIIVRGWFRISGERGERKIGKEVERSGETVFCAATRVSGSRNRDAASESVSNSSKFSGK